MIWTTDDYDGVECDGLGGDIKKLPKRQRLAIVNLFMVFLVLTEDDKLSRAAFHRLPSKPVTPLSYVTSLSSTTRGLYETVTNKMVLPQ